MFDKEIEAIAKCTELIKDLDDDAKVRVMKYLIERFGIGMIKSHNTNQPRNEQQNSQLIESNSDETYEDVESENIENTDYPSLRDLVIKDYPKNESEWILVYGFYSSNYGNDTFTRDDLISNYDSTNRKTTQRIKNLSQSIKTGIKKDWYKSLNEKEYILLESGKTYASEIINGNSSGSTRKREKKQNR